MPMRLLSLLGAGLLAGCASGNFVPASLQAQIDKTLTFPQLRESPDSYRGHLLVLGGEVLSAKRLKDGTRIEVLEIPLDRSFQPDPDRTPVALLPTIESLNEQPPVTIASSHVPNRGPTYLHCCVFLI